MKRSLVVLVATLAVLLVGGASAQDERVNLLADPGFEKLFGLNSGFASPGAAWGYTQVESAGCVEWTWSGGTMGITNPSTGFYVKGVPEGHLVAYVWGGEVSQVVDVVLEANTRYELSVWAGYREQSGVNSFGGGLLQLWAGDTLLDEKALTVPERGYFALTDLTYDTTGFGISDLPAGNLKVVLVSHGIAGGVACTDFDNVKLLATPVPEPATMALLALGGLAMLRRRKAA